MKTLIFFILVICSIQYSFSQTLKVFQGGYENGTATYQYYENDNFERIFQGSFKYKGTIIDGIKGKLNLAITGLYAKDKKDGKWVYILTDPDIKGITENISGSYTNGSMEGEWNLIATQNNNKKTVIKSTAFYKSNKLIGDYKFDITSPVFKEYASVSLNGIFNNSGLFEGVWTTTYAQGAIQYEEVRKYRNGVLYWLLHRRLSDGKILEKLDSTSFVDQFFHNYDSVKKCAVIKNQKFVFKEILDKYSGTLDIPIVLTNFWTVNNKNINFYSITANNPIFLIEHGFEPSPVFHERIIINWNSTKEGEKQLWQEEQDRKAKEEQYKAEITKADTAFSKKQYQEAIKFYTNSLIFKDDIYPKNQITKAQQIIDQERNAKEQEEKAKEKAYQEIISKADHSLNEKKFEVAIELYKGALNILDEQYPKDQLLAIKLIQNEEIRLKAVQELDKYWINVDAGTFKMGCLRNDPSCLKYEEPVHEVAISTFKISKYEVTNSQYKIYCQVKGKKEPQGLDSIPATNISWNEAVNYAEWLGCRLPTEAEWEYAARGGVKNKKYIYSGSSDLDEIAWYHDNSSNSVHIVGKKLPNTIGIFDMSGNVWEWCSDWFGDYKDNSDIDPKGPSTGTQRVKRGGSCSDTNFEIDLRVTNRSSEPPESTFYNLGFRLVKK